MKKASGPRKYEIADFEVQKTIGKGSFGTVKLAYDKKAKTLVAIKCLVKSSIRSKTHIQHIHNEKKILGHFKA